MAPVGRPLLDLNHHVHAVAQPRYQKRHTSSPTQSENDWVSQAASAWPPHPHYRSLPDLWRSVQAAAASWHEEAGDLTQHAPSVRGRARVLARGEEGDARGAPTAGIPRVGYVSRCAYIAIDKNMVLRCVWLCGCDQAGRHDPMKGNMVLFVPFTYHQTRSKV